MASNNEEFRRRLIAFWRMYEPTQLRIIDQWLTNWDGREKELFEELVRFHGPEPHLAHKTPVLTPVVESRDSKLATTCRHLLQQTILLYAPHRIVEVDNWFAMWEGRHDELLARLQRQVALRDHIMKFFAEHHPDRLEEVPALLRVWLGHESSLMTALAKTKGAPLKLPPRPAIKADGDMRDDDKTPLPFASYRTQLQHFYRVFNPDKMSEVDIILQSYEGREPQLFQKLFKRYCEKDKKENTSAAEAKLPGSGEQEEVVVPPKASLARPLVRHLIAANSVEQTAHLEDFVQNFNGTDAELAWALRTYCRKGDQSPEAHTTRSELIDTQIADLQQKIRAMPPLPTAPVTDPSQLILDAHVAADATSDQLHVSMHTVLSRVGLEHLTSIFIKNEITVELFPCLTANDLAEMGIHPDANRRHVLNQLRKLY